MWLELRRGKMHAFIPQYLLLSNRLGIMDESFVFLPGFVLL